MDVFENGNFYGAHHPANAGTKPMNSRIGRVKRRGSDANFSNALGPDPLPADYDITSGNSGSSGGSCGTSLGNGTSFWGINICNILTGKDNSSLNICSPSVNGVDNSKLNVCSPSAKGFLNKGLCFTLPTWLTFPTTSNTSSGGGGGNASTPTGSSNAKKPVTVDDLSNKQGPAPAQTTAAPKIEAGQLPAEKKKDNTVWFILGGGALLAVMVLVIATKGNNSAPVIIANPSK